MSDAQSKPVQHRHTHTDAGAGEAKPDPPVAKAAPLLTFEVVSATKDPFAAGDDGGPESG